MANGPLNKRALDLLWAMYQKVGGDIEKQVLPDEVARETNIIDPSWYHYNEIYAATMNYLVERKEALVFVDEPFPKARYYKITLEGRQLLREEGYPVTR